jgi:glycosyltransferase involved in cell wall biosynthesis
VTFEPKVTVLIPCHSLQYLDTAVRSVAAQTLARNSYEVLLIADRIDIRQAAAILRDAAVNFRIKESLQPGIVSALNLGIASISTEYIARMDEDDIMLPHRLEAQIDFLEKNPGFVAVGGQLALIDSSGNFLDYGTYPKLVRKERDFFYRGSPMPHPATTIRTSVLQTVGGYRNFVPEDWDLWIRLSEQGRIRNLDEVVLQYRVHNKQLSRNRFYSDMQIPKLLLISQFARRNSLRDSPESLSERELWARVTSTQLEVVSPSYVRASRKMSGHLNFRQKFQELRKQKFGPRLVFHVIRKPILSLVFVQEKIERVLMIRRIEVNGRGF